MTAKVFNVDSLRTGLTAYCTIRRNADAYLMVAADGTFAIPSGTVADNCTTMAEGAVAGRYTLSENRVPWSDGDHTIIAYEQIGGTPDPLSDPALGYGVVGVDSDAETFTNPRDRIIDGTITQAELERLHLSELAGDATVPAGAGAYEFKGQDGTTVRLAGTVAADGTRTPTTVNGAP